MWRRLSKPLRTLTTTNLHSSATAATVSSPPPPPHLPIFTAVSRHFTADSSTAVSKKKVEDVMPIATGHEREELEAELQEAPAIVKSYYDKRIVGCPGGEGEDEHDVVWFWLEKGKPHECPVCLQYFELEVVGPGGPPDGHDLRLRCGQPVVTGGEDALLVGVEKFLFLSITIGGITTARHRTMNTGGRTPRRTCDFGRTYVVKPKGRHQATIVWLHGLGDNGSSWAQLLEALPLPNIKWICPTAPTRPVALLGGFPCAAWFDVGELSEDSPDDFEGLDASAAHIANLLSGEPADIKLGVGGFSMGAATALYSATCFAHGRFTNGNPYPVNLRAIVGLSGWLPGSRSLRNKIEGSHEAARRAASLPILLCHGNGDDVVPYKFGEKSTQFLGSAGFRYVSFKTYDGLGHYTVPKEMDEVCNWLNGRLGLDGFRS
ncbi:hypothetical protein RHMOL_Rhmol12G0228400 [Rhododendron molle]|uniref:Uncharacterized protein n=1 Tax=Rhododendron molle TaxID=49168 RepID=A0ACC0LL29_RHOML|nr:hypothetical protein RHMOL_Rhmol12G0228400 [Rhododendron molle]